MDKKNPNPENPLIWLPLKLLAARGNIEFSAPADERNFPALDGGRGILKARDWINQAYLFCLEILRDDPLQIALDELFDAGEDDDCPKAKLDATATFSKQYLQREIARIQNRKPKPNDTMRLQIATALVRIIPCEDLISTNDFNQSIIHDVLQEHWRLTLNKLLNFAVDGFDHKNIYTLLCKIKADVSETKAEAAGAKVAAEGARTAAEKGANNSETTGRLVLNHMTPRPGDYEVKQKGLSEILEGLKAKVTVKTIQRWEKYLATNGNEGTKPPEGYTLQTRQTLAGATAWAKTYAAREKSKLNTKVSLDRLTGGRH